MKEFARGNTRQKLEYLIMLYLLVVSAYISIKIKGIGGIKKLFTVE